MGGCMYPFHKRFLSYLASLLFIFPGLTDAMSVLKGTYDCLQNKYAYLSPYSGAVLYETGFIRNIYHYGLQDQDKEFYKDSIVGLIKALFHENNLDGQFIPSSLEDIKSMTHELLGTIVGHIVKGDLQKNRKKIITSWANISKVDGGIIGKKIDLIINAIKQLEKEVDTTIYPPHIVEYILLTFLYAKYLNDPQAQEQKKDYFVRYLKAVNEVITVLKEDSSLDDELFLTDLYQPLEYQKFEKNIQNSAEQNADKQIDYMKKHTQESLNALITRRFYASDIPKQAVQSYFGYKDQIRRPDCVEVTLFDMLVVILLYNPISKAFDLSLLPEGLQVNDQLKSLIEDGILTPQTINDSRVRQEWYNLVSGHCTYTDDKGKPDNVKNLIYCKGEGESCYEMDTFASQVIKLSNLLYGIDAKNFEELDKKLSTKERTITFIGPKNPLIFENDTNDCIITMNINKGAIVATLTLTRGHAVLSVPLRNASHILNQYYASTLSDELIKTGLKTDQEILLFALFDNADILHVGDKLSLSTLFLIYYNLAMTDPNTRLLVVCSMISHLKYHPTLLSYVVQLTKTLVYDEHYKKEIVTALLQEENALQIITQMTSFGINEELLIQASARGLLGIVKYFIDKGVINRAAQLTAIQYAAFAGSRDLVAYIIEHGDVGEVGKKGAFIQAADQGHVNIVDYLLKAGVDLNAHDKYGNSGLVLAARNGHVELVKFLLDEVNKDKKMISQKNKLQSDAALNAAVLAYINNKTSLDACLTILDYLITHGNAELEYQAYLDELPNTTPLIEAARAGALEIVKFLVEHGAEIKAVDAFENTPLKAASVKRHTEVVEYLKKAEEELRKNEERKEE